MASALLGACSTDIDGPKSGEPSAPVSETRDVNEILEIAADAYKILNNNSRNELSLSVSDIVPVRKSLARSETAEPVLYAVNYGEGRGFALVSSRRDIEPLIGLIENGDYSDSDTSVGPFNLMLDCAEMYASAKKIEIPDTNKIEIGIRPYYDTIINVFVSEPRIKVQWGQSWPENMFCPNKIAGCAPVALGQVMTFIKSPSEISITFNSSGERLALDWEDIGKHTLSDNFGVSIPPSSITDVHYDYCDASLSAHRTIGLLIRELGHRMNAAYEAKGTVAYDDELFTTTKSLLTYSSVTLETDLRNLYADANNSNTAIEIIGQNIGSNPNDRNCWHVWTIDGAFREEIKIYYVTGVGYPAILTYTEVSSRQNRYIHNNWGYCGYKNGYFLEGVYNLSRNPKNPPESSERPPIIYNPTNTRDSDSNYTPLKYIKILKI